jgi:hypothetical protein
MELRFLNIIAYFFLKNKGVPQKFSYLKKDRANRTVLFVVLLTLAAHLSEALATINRTVRLGLKRNLCLATAGSANSSEILPRATGGSLAGIAAGFAALRLVLETALSVKLLLAGGEYELLAAFFTH